MKIHIEDNAVKIRKLKVEGHISKEDKDYHCYIVAYIKEIIECFDTVEYEELIYFLNMPIYWETLERMYKNNCEGIDKRLKEPIFDFLISNVEFVKEYLKSRERSINNELREQIFTIIQTHNIKNFCDLINYLENFKNKEHKSIIIINDDTHLIRQRFKNSKGNAYYEYKEALYRLIKRYERLIKYVTEHTEFFDTYFKNCRN